jgi:hypothetical protein
MALSSVVIMFAVVGYNRQHRILSIIKASEDRQDKKLKDRVIRTISLWGISF